MLHASVNPAAVSTVLGSVMLLPTILSASPRGLLSGAPGMLTVVTTLVTLIVVLTVVLTSLSLSVAVSVTTYLPLSSGVNVNDEALPPLPNVTPSFWTLHTSVNPAALSSVLGSVMLLP